MAKDAGTKNIIYMATKDGALTAAMPMVNGSLIQLFLTNRNVSAYYVGLFSTLVSIITVVGMMLCSYLSEKLPKPSPGKPAIRSVLITGIPTFLAISKAR